VTSKDVAARAGVSQSAVSLVLSGKGAGRVAPAKAAAIRTAAQELGYRPNVAARTLRTGATDTVGLVVPDVRNPFFGALLRGAQHAARAAGRAVLLVDAQHDAADATAPADVLRASGAVDGLLWFGRLPPDHVREDRIPLVLVEAELEGVTSVRFGVEDGFRAIGEHLRDLGHRRVGALRAKVPQEPTFEVRAAGLEAGLGFAPQLEAVAPVITLEAGLVAARELLDRPDRPTAIVADDDNLAAAVVLVARELGIAVPGELSVAGCDDLDVVRVLDVTTVRLEAEELGRVALEALTALLDGEDPPARQVLPAVPVLRGSTGPAPGPR
jgi:DNA-binding LacI/PurR family transcriptional regulator